jgi:hypothetical protein
MLMIRHVPKLLLLALTSCVVPVPESFQCAKPGDPVAFERQIELVEAKAFERGKLGFPPDEEARSGAEYARQCPSYGEYRRQALEQAVQRGAERGFTTEYCGATSAFLFPQERVAACPESYPEARSFRAQMLGLLKPSEAPPLPDEDALQARYERLSEIAADPENPGRSDAAAEALRIAGILDGLEARETARREQREDERAEMTRTCEEDAPTDDLRAACARFFRENGAMTPL